MIFNTYQMEYGLYNGGKQTLSKFFGKDTNYIYDTIYGNQGISIMLQSPYAYGMFYGHNHLIPIKANALQGKIFRGMFQI